MTRTGGEQAHPQEWFFGWSKSPLYSNHTEHTLTDDNGRRVAVGQCNRMEVDWFSWSSLTLVIGIGPLWMATRLRSKLST